MLTSCIAVLATPVHPAFPFPLGATLHASRISLAFHTNVHLTSSRLSWGAHMLGFLLMCWGGTFATHFLLSLPPPQLYAPGPWINYSAVHLLFTVLFHYFPTPDPSVSNAFLFPLDALLRANSITQAISFLALPSINPLLVASPLFHFILGAAASAAGGLVGGTFSLWTPNWHLSTPPPLRTGVFGVWSTLEVWAGGIVATTYSVLTAHPAFLPLRAYIISEDAKPLPTLDAKAAAAGVMISLYALRVAALTLSPPAAKPAAKGSGEKVKVQ